MLYKKQCCQVAIEGDTALKKLPQKSYLILSSGKGSEESNKSEKTSVSVMDAICYLISIKKEIKRRVMPEKSC